MNAVIPGTDLRTAKVYFRSDKYPKFYYVEMKGGAEGLLSVLPKPSPETGSIVYYIEAVDVTFNNTIGAEYTVEVTESCAQLEDAPDSADEEPEIVVGSTEAGAAALPPGFETAGIVGTITAAGLGSIVSGGSGIGTAVVVSGVAAGVGGVVATQVVEADPTPTESTPDRPTPEPPPSSSAPPTTQTPSPSPTPSPPSPSPPDGEPPVPPTSPPSEPPPLPPPPSSMVTACFTVSFPGNSCNMKVDASCSTSSAGSIASYDWELAASGAMGGVTTASGRTANRTFPGCAGEVVNVTLSVADNGGGTDTLSRSIALPTESNATPRSESTVHGTLISFLDVRPLDGAHHGSIELNGVRADVARNVAPQRHDFDAQLGDNTVGASLLSEVGREVLWTFDFAESTHFAPGSLRPLQGSVLGLTERRITFRLSGAPGERVRFEYRLVP